MNIVILLAGGTGSRMNSSIAKQHIVINQHQIIEYTLTAFSACPSIDKIIVVSNPNYINTVMALKENFLKLQIVCEGGETRMLSVLNGIKAISDFANDNDKIIISDAARPCITIKEIDQLILSLDTYIAATSGLECYETILKTENETIIQITPRDGLIRQTSPEGYKFKALKWLYLNSTEDLIRNYKNIGIDQLCASGQKIGITKSNPLNFKITTQDDIKLFENILKEGFERFIKS